MKILRTTATHIMSRALHHRDNCLMGVMDEMENVFYAESAEDMEGLVVAHPGAVWIYNQNPVATDKIEQMLSSDGQRCIEIFQDTKGVFGLRAYLQQGKLQKPITLEFEDR